MSASRKKKSFMVLVSLVFVLLLILPTAAQAEIYEYNQWSVVEGNSGDPGAIAAQFSVEVTDDFEDKVGEQVLFTFRNNGPLPSIIADIYFDDGALVEIANIINSSGVNFFDPANPANLPGGENVVPEFETSGDFSADFEKGAGNGVDPGESVGIVFNLKPDKYFANVINAIHVGFNPDLYYDFVNQNWLADNLRIGLHVQGTGENEDFSDTFILTPVPGAFILGILGLGLAGIKLRKFA